MNGLLNSLGLWDLDAERPKCVLLSRVSILTILVQGEYTIHTQERSNATINLDFTKKRLVMKLVTKANAAKPHPFFLATAINTYTPNLPPTFKQNEKQYAD